MRFWSDTFVISGFMKKQFRNIDLPIKIFFFQILWNICKQLYFSFQKCRCAKSRELFFLHTILRVPLFSFYSVPAIEGKKKRRRVKPRRGRWTPLFASVDGIGEKWATARQELKILIFCFDKKNFRAENRPSNSSLMKGNTLGRKGWMPSPILSNSTSITSRVR